MTVYALRHPDGRYLYHLPKPDTDAFKHQTLTGAQADGEPMEKLPSGWWASATQASRLTVTAQPAPRTVGYKLRDPNAQSVRYPATLTAAEWDERSDRGSDTLWELYDFVQEPQPALEHVYDGPIVLMEGREPPAADELPWQANLPDALASRPEYLHLFPGRIHGFRDHVQGLIKKLPGVRHCFDNFQNYKGLHVTLHVPFEQPQTRWQADISRRTGKSLKSGRNVPDLVSRELRLPVPESITAPNYETAVDDWHEQVEFWLSIVRNASVAACNACNGTGHVNHGSEQYSR